MQKLRPILFNTEMVKAILTGRKTVTRRIADINTDITCNDGTINHDFILDNFTGGKATGFVCRRCGFGMAPPHSRIPCGSSLFRPRYWPGDILYIRETWSFWPCYDCDSEMCYGRGISYKDTDGCFVYKTQRSKVPYEEKWKPSIHMPKEAARIFLQVNHVRLERLQAISADECAMEGVWPLYTGPIDGREEYYKTAFANLWDLTIKPVDIPNYGWRANPWVWVIEFERIIKEIRR